MSNPSNIQHPPHPNPSGSFRTGPGSGTLSSNFSPSFLHPKSRLGRSNASLIFSPGSSVLPMLQSASPSVEVADSSPLLRASQAAVSAPLLASMGSPSPTIDTHLQPVSGPQLDHRSLGLTKQMDYFSDILGSIDPVRGFSDWAKNNKASTKAHTQCDASNFEINVDRNGLHPQAQQIPEVGVQPNAQPNILGTLGQSNSEQNNGTVWQVGQRGKQPSLGHKFAGNAQGPPIETFAKVIGNKNNLPSFIFDDTNVHPIGSLKKNNNFNNVVAFTSPDIAHMASKCKNCLIGKFSHGIPIARDIVNGLAGLGLVGPYSWSFLNLSHIAIKLENEEDYSKLWLGTTWKINGCPMRIFKWTPEFDPKFEDSLAPIWCRFPGLPMHLFDTDALYTIASAIGKPLKVDHPTAQKTRLAFARICIEIDLLATRPDEITLDLAGRIVKQKVVYGTIPKYCSGCRHVGHALEDCYIVGNKPRPPPPIRKPPPPTETQSMRGKGHEERDAQKIHGRFRSASRGRATGDKGKEVIREIRSDGEEHRKVPSDGGWQQVCRKKSSRETGLIPHELMIRGFETHHTRFSALYELEPSEVRPTRFDFTHPLSSHEKTFQTEIGSETESGEYISMSEGTAGTDSGHRLKDYVADISEPEEVGSINVHPEEVHPAAQSSDGASGIYCDGPLAMVVYTGGDTDFISSPPVKMAEVGAVCQLNRAQHEISSHTGSSAAFVPIIREKDRSTTISSLPKKKKNDLVSQIPRGPGKKKLPCLRAKSPIPVGRSQQFRAQLLSRATGSSRSTSQATGRSTSQ